MQTQPATILPPDARSARIRQLAYQLWEDAGRPDGDDLTFWLCAEAQINRSLREEAAGLPAAPEAATSKVHLNGLFPASPAPEESGPRPSRQQKQNRSVRLPRRATATTR
jgi:hypothetical protein